MSSYKSDEQGMMMEDDEANKIIRGIDEELGEEEEMEYEESQTLPNFLTENVESMVILYVLFMVLTTRKVTEGLESIVPFLKTNNLYGKLVCGLALVVVYKLVLFYRKK